MKVQELRNSLKEGYAKQAHRVQELFGGLSQEQLLWKPDEKSWCVGECLHHIWITNDKYLANLDLVIRESTRKEPADQDYSSSYFGARFMEMVGPTGGKNTPVPKVLMPDAARVPRDVVQLVLDQLEGFQEFLAESEGTDLRRTKMSSPIAKMIRLPLGDVFLALQGHNERHINQAQRVTRSGGFPA